MPNKTDSGLALIRASQSNLEWWLNSSHSNSLPRKAYELLLKIHQKLNEGINDNYQFKRFELFKKMDEYLDSLIKRDSNAHAVDMRIIFNLPENKILNQGYVIKAAPYNITFNG